MNNKALLLQLVAYRDEIHSELGALADEMAELKWWHIKSFVLTRRESYRLGELRSVTWLIRLMSEG